MTKDVIPIIVLTDTPEDVKRFCSERAGPPLIRRVNLLETIDRLESETGELRYRGFEDLADYEQDAVDCMKYLFWKQGTPENGHWKWEAKQAPVKRAKSVKSKEQK